MCRWMWCAVVIFAGVLGQESHARQEGVKPATPATEPSLNQEAGDSGFESRVQEIKAQFEEMPYSENEAPYGTPFCYSVVERKREENRRVLQALSEGNPSATAILDEADFVSPSPEALAKKAPRTFTSAKMAETDSESATGAREESGESARPGFWAKGTQVQTLTISQDKSFAEETSAISEVKAGSYVLSSTSFLIDDPRYQRTCWAEVTKVHEEKIGANREYVRLLYDDKSGTQIELDTAFDSGLEIFSKLGSESFGPVSCLQLKRNGVLFSPDEVDPNAGECVFSAKTNQTTDKEQVFYNLDVALTGVYFVGPLRGQILIRN